MTRTLSLPGALLGALLALTACASSTDVHVKLAPVHATLDTAAK